MNLPYDKTSKWSILNYSKKLLGKTLDGKTSAAISEMDNELDELRTDLAGMDIPDNVVNDLDRMASEAAEANQQLDNTRENVRAFGEEAPQGIFHASTAVTQFGSAVMSASMLVNSWQSMMSTFSDSSATGLEKLGAVLSVVTATMTTFTAIQALATTLSKADAIAKMGQAAGQAAANLMAKIGIGVKSAETGVVVANTAAWYANPVMWIALIIVAVIAAVVALIAAIASLTEWLIKGDKIETENCDTLIENAEKTKELAAANEELSDSMDDLIEEYKEMNEEGENTSAILQQIQDNMPELIDSYKELAKVLGNPELTAGIAELERLANVAALTGDYSAFEKKKEEVDNQVAIETAKAAESGAIAANTVLAAKMQETQGKVSGKKYTLDVGGADGDAVNAVGGQTAPLARVVFVIGKLVAVEARKAVARGEPDHAGLICKLRGCRKAALFHGDRRAPPPREGLVLQRTIHNTNGKEVQE